MGVREYKSVRFCTSKELFKIKSFQKISIIMMRIVYAAMEERKKKKWTGLFRIMFT